MDVPAPLGSYLTPSFEHARVGDAMRPGVLTCGRATPLVTVAQRMASEHVHAIVVLADGDGRDPRPFRVVTDADVLRAADRIDDLTAGEAATAAVLETNPDEPLREAAGRMARQGVTHMLVVDPRTGRPVAVLSTLDIAGILGWGRA
jgi:CBS domain-containing protein